MLQLYRNTAPQEILPITKEISFQNALMGEYKITVENLVLPRLLNIRIGDYLIYNNIKYKINTVPNYEKVEHTNNHKYDITFEHPSYTLYDKILMIEGEGEFPGFGVPEYYLQLIVDSINTVDEGWTIGNIDLADEQHISFDNVSCRVALTTIAEAFGMEFYFDGEGKRINLVAKVGVDRDITLQYGKGKGLYTIQRTYVEDQNIVTRVYGVGGSRNLPEGYTKSSLQLSAPLEANIDLYGVKEGVFKNEDIFPTRTGVVSSVGAYDADSNFNTLTDVDLDFDINDYRAAGLSWKIGFQNGDLAGEEFEITNYDHANKTITYLTNKDTSVGIILPNEALQAKAGDKYKLLDIYLPQSYVDAALTRLQQEAQEYLDKAKFPRVAYSLMIDVLHFKRNGYNLNPGDRIRIIDTDINLDTTIRVTSVTYPLAFYEDNALWTDMKYEVELANDFIPYTDQERIQIEQKEQKKAIYEQSKLSKHTRAAMEEIARAAALNQFQRTYVGELAILTGALIVGNPELGAVAGVSGLEDVITAIRFFAGADFENRGTAPFRVNQAGQMWASDAFVQGVIEALSGKIGNWIISNGGIINEDGTAYIIARELLDGGKEAAAMIGTNIISSILGFRATGLFRNTEVAPLFTNYALILEASGGGDNMALDILSGQVAGLNLRSRQIDSSQTLTRQDVWISAYNTAPITVTLPANPNSGKVMYIRQMNNVGVGFNGNGNNIHVDTNVGTGYSNIDASNGDTHMLFFDGQYWCYNWLRRQ